MKSQVVAILSPNGLLKFLGFSLLLCEHCAHSQTALSHRWGSDRLHTAGADHLAHSVMQQTVHLQHWPQSKQVSRM